MTLPNMIGDAIQAAVHGVFFGLMEAAAVLTLIWAGRAIARLR